MANYSDSSGTYYLYMKKTNLTVTWYAEGGVYGAALQQENTEG
mgnify:CR=1 FL=1